MGFLTDFLEGKASNRAYGGAGALGLGLAGAGLGTQGGRNLLFGESARPEYLDTLNPQQQQRLSSLMGMGEQLQPQAMNYLQQLLSGSPEALQAFQAPAMRQFQEQILPQISERFAGMGAGSQSSGAFNRAVAGAGTTLAENLAAQRAQLQQGALQQALGLYKDPLGVKAMQPMMREATPGLAQSLAQGAVKAGTYYMGGGLQ